MELFWFLGTGLWTSRSKILTFRMEVLHQCTSIFREKKGVPAPGTPPQQSLLPGLQGSGPQQVVFPPVIRAPLTPALLSKGKCSFYCFCAIGHIPWGASTHVLSCLFRLSLEVPIIVLVTKMCKLRYLSLTYFYSSLFFFKLKYS